LLTRLTSAREPVSGAVVAGLCRGWPKEGSLARTAEMDDNLVKLFRGLSSRGQGQLVELAARWHSPALEKQTAEISEKFLGRVRDEKASDRERADTAAQLVELRRTDAGVINQLLELLTPRTSPALAQDLLQAIGHSEAPQAAAALINVLPALTPDGRTTGFRVLLSRADWTGALLDAAEKGLVQLSDLALDQRQELLTRRGIARRAQRLLSRGAGLPDPDRQKVVDELMALTQKKGDAAAGKLVYKNNCAVCHTHGGEGGKVGPDLTGMAVHPKSHLLVDILDPSRNVEGNYRQYLLTTRTGHTLSGLLASETRTSVELLDAQGKRHAVMREDIDELQVSRKSLMPEGFEKQISKNDMVNLLEFLTQKGKFLPLPLGKVATVVSTKGMFYSSEDLAERLVFNDWSPKVFQGIPFTLVDPHGDRVPNVVLLYGPQGSTPPKMPRSVTLPCNMRAKAIHLLSGISGWGYPSSEKGTVSLIVRLRYEDGQTEEHVFKNGEHFADYIRRVDVPGSQFAFSLTGRQQVRYLALEPSRREKIQQIEFIKGPDETAPLIAAVTVEADE
jgi:putative heme-binding domain-containing protein